MAEHLRRFEAEEGVGFIGKAQERAAVSAPRSGVALGPASLTRGSSNRQQW